MDDAFGPQGWISETNPRAMQRREHRKSRNGCTPCKKRRVKCDEKTPCSNCVRRKEECDNFLPQSVRTCKNCFNKQNAATSTRALYLMHHYTRYTAGSLMDNREMIRQWEVVIPEEALRHPFLMEGLLALSALHLTSLRPNERATWTPLALKHQNIALTHFRSTIPELNEVNCHALLALSILISIASMAFSSFGTSLSQGEYLPISDIIEPFTLIRGVGELLGVAVQWLFMGPLRSILVGHVVNICQAPTPGPVAERFKVLQQMVAEMCPEEETRRVLAKALVTLQYVFTEVVCSKGTELNKDPGIGWKWPHMCSQEYTSLLRESHGGALVIFAHFALLSKTWSGVWYLHNWTPRVVDGISGNIDSCWQEWLEWPKQQIRDDYPILSSSSASDEEEPNAKAIQNCASEAAKTPPAVDVLDDNGNFALKLHWKGKMIPVPQTIDEFYKIM